MCTTRPVGITNTVSMLNWEIHSEEIGGWKQLSGQLQAPAALFLELSSRHYLCERLGGTQTRAECFQKDRAGRPAFDRQPTCPNLRLFIIHTDWAAVSRILSEVERREKWQESKLELTQGFEYGAYQVILYNPLNDLYTVTDCGPSLGRLTFINVAFN